MGMLRQLVCLQAAATGPPRLVFAQEPAPRTNILETIMIPTIETGPAAAGAIAFRPHPAHGLRAILSLDLGTTTGWALRSHDGLITSGTVSFRSSRYDGGGMRYLRLRSWLDQIAANAGGLAAIYFEEVRRHIGTDAAHLHGGFLATLTAWCEQRTIAYQGVPVGTIKRHVAARGNADKAAVMAAIRARGFSPADDNEADAIAILLWAIETDGGVR
ncbi:MAG: crossover junction endodeoxyribonuclease RuvC [Allosphingosinicella sp.]|uniref:crossover junction endodeoxyribonuclease RuvC n=1 Tax=Allosphingosinicella sp. TaxID=2823234 RepID=UPI0039459F23